MELIKINKEGTEYKPSIPAEHNFVDFSDPDEYSVILLVRLLIASCAIAGNLLIITIFCVFPRFRRVQSNVLIALLSMSGFMVGIGIAVRAIYVMFFYDPNQCDRRTCIAIGHPQIVGLIFGQVTILALAMDRYSAVKRPCQYLLINVTKGLTIVITICIALTLFFGWLAFYDISDKPCSQCNVGATSTPLYQAAWLGFGAANAMLVIGLYVKAVRLLNAQLNAKCGKHVHTLRVQQCAFIAISMVVLCYVIFWCLPVFFSIVLWLADSSEILRGYVSITFGLGEGLNSSLSVLIYLYKHQEIRQCTKELFHGSSNFSRRRSGQVFLACSRSKANHEKIKPPFCVGEPKNHINTPSI